MARKVLMDADSGNDDALALMMLAAQPDIDLVALTTVAGNVPADVTARNALDLVAYLGLDIPVAQGSVPLLAPYECLSASLMGPRGLGAAELPHAEGRLSELPSTELIWQMLCRYLHELEILATGPLTNLALLIRLHPEASRLIKRLVLMGGSRFGGNTSPAAEFNIHTDPEAAHIVFASGAPLSMVGLEVGYDHRLRREDFARLAVCAPRIGAFAGQLFFYPGTPEHTLSERGWPVFDSLAAAVLIDPQCAQTAEWFVDVETKGALTYGETVIDEKGRLKQKPQTKVVLGYPHDRYLELLAQSLAALG